METDLEDFGGVDIAGKVRTVAPDVLIPGAWSADDGGRQRLMGCREQYQQLTILLLKTLAAPNGIPRGIPSGILGG